MHLSHNNLVFTSKLIRTFIFISIMLLSDLYANTISSRSQSTLSVLCCLQMSFYKRLVQCGINIKSKYIAFGYFFKCLSISNNLPPIILFSHAIYLLKKQNNLYCRMPHLLDLSDYFLLVSFNLLKGNT